MLFLQLMLSIEYYVTELLIGSWMIFQFTMWIKTFDKQRDEDQTATLKAAPNAPL